MSEINFAVAKVKWESWVLMFTHGNENITFIYLLNHWFQNFKLCSIYLHVLKALSAVL